MSTLLVCGIVGGLLGAMLGRNLFVKVVSGIGFAVILAIIFGKT